MLNRLRQSGNLIVFSLGLWALVVVAAPVAPPTDQLQNLSTKIEQARSEGATMWAPMSLRLAETELLRAHNAVRTLKNRPLAVEHALEMVEYRVEELRRVLNTRKQAHFEMSEETARQRVRASHPELSPTLSKNEAVD